MIAALLTYSGMPFRTSGTPEEPLFVAADVCRILEIENVTDALRRLDLDERTLVSIEGASNNLPVNAVTESGLYSLILGSRKPQAKDFKRWVTHEVLPAIRRTGSYSLAPVSALPQSYAEAVRADLTRGGIAHVLIYEEKGYAVWRTTKGYLHGSPGRSKKGETQS